MDEKRVETRERRLKPGRVVFNSMSSVVTCTLRDISASGARLRFGTLPYTPEEFMVSVPGEIDLRPARRVWATRNEIGVRFTGR